MQCAQQNVHGSLSCLHTLKRKVYRFYNFVDDFFWGCVAQTHLEPRRYRRDHVPGLVTFFMF